MIINVEIQLTVLEALNICSIFAPTLVVKVCQLKKLDCQFLVFSPILNIFLIGIIWACEPGFNPGPLVRPVISVTTKP